MITSSRKKRFGALAGVFCFCVSIFLSSAAFSGEVTPQPKMPAHWKVISDYIVPPEQVKSISSKLGADLRGVRNTVYLVSGKRVQVNVIATPDHMNAKRLMTRLRTMKSEEALLQKGLIVYEFVGPNDVLTLIAEGREYLQSR